MSENGSQVVVLNTSVRPEQKAAIVQYQKDNDCLSVSEALRDILDEWMIFCELDTDASNAGGDQVPA